MKRQNMIRRYAAAAVIAACLCMQACHGVSIEGNRITGADEGAFAEPVPVRETEPSRKTQKAQEHQTGESSPEQAGNGAAGESSPGQAGDGAAGESSPGQASDGAAAQTPGIKVLDNLGTGSVLMTGGFRKVGDMNTHLAFYVLPGEDGDIFPSDRLGVSFTVLNMEKGRTVNGSGYGEIVTEKGKTEYQMRVEVQTYRESRLASQEDTSVQIAFMGEDFAGLRISIRGGGILEGDYYDESQMCRLAPEVFSRYLCRAELCNYPAENLQLIRNTIYASHGRRFQSESLRRYFEEQPWYRGTVEPEDFSESVLSDVERKNIALIQELEQRDDKSRQEDQEYALENLDFAPYLSYLDENRETGMWADISQAEDRGAYWSMPGWLSLPVTITRSQWEAVASGRTVEVCTDELTGETQLLKRLNGTECILYEKGKEPDPAAYPSDIGTGYNYDTGLYELWMASDDTIMKRVYEGDIYILKGAVAGADVSLEGASGNQREILPVSAAGNTDAAAASGTDAAAASGMDTAGAPGMDAAEAWDLDPPSVSGNALRHNGRGYFTAVYSLGD